MLPWVTAAFATEPTDLAGEFRTWDGRVAGFDLAGPVRPPTSTEPTGRMRRAGVVQIDPGPDAFRLVDAAGNQVTVWLGGQVPGGRAVVGARLKDAQTSADGLGARVWSDALGWVRLAPDNPIGSVGPDFLWVPDRAAFVAAFAPLLDEASVVGSLVAALDAGDRERARGLAARLHTDAFVPQVDVSDGWDVWTEEVAAGRARALEVPDLIALAHEATTADDEARDVLHAQLLAEASAPDPTLQLVGLALAEAVGACPGGPTQALADALVRRAEVPLHEQVLARWLVPSDTPLCLAHLGRVEPYESPLETRAREATREWLLEDAARAAADGRLATAAAEQGLATRLVDTDEAARLARLAALDRERALAGVLMPVVADAAGALASTLPRGAGVRIQPRAWPAAGPHPTVSFESSWRLGPGTYEAGDRPVLEAVETRREVDNPEWAAWSEAAGAVALDAAARSRVIDAIGARIDLLDRQIAAVAGTVPPDGSYVSERGLVTSTTAWTDEVGQSWEGTSTSWQGGGPSGAAAWSGTAQRKLILGFQEQRRQLVAKAQELASGASSAPAEPPRTLTLTEVSYREVGTEFCQAWTFPIEGEVVVEGPSGRTAQRFEGMSRSSWRCRPTGEDAPRFVEDVARLEAVHNFAPPDPVAALEPVWRAAFDAQVDAHAARWEGRGQEGEREAEWARWWAGQARASWPWDPRSEVRVRFPGIEPPEEACPEWRDR